jgi:hypothetical protein
MKTRKKISKKTANYRSATGPEHCGNCIMFRRSSNTRNLAAGLILPQAVCDEWEAMTDATVKMTALRWRAARQAAIRALGTRKELPV